MRFYKYIIKLSDKPNALTQELFGDFFTFEQFQIMYEKIRKYYMYGINDIKDADEVSSEKWYNTWKDIIKRVNGLYESKSNSNKSYVNCEVDCRWLMASNFKEWYMNSIYEIDSYDILNIDKDIKVPGNKLYAPHTCLIVPSKINKFFIDSYKLNRDYTKTKDNNYKAAIKIFNTDKCIYLYNKDEDKLVMRRAKEKNRQLRELVIPYFKNIVHPSYKNHPMVQLVLRTLEEYDFVAIEERNKKLFEQIDSKLTPEQIKAGGPTREELIDILDRCDTELTNQFNSIHRVPEDIQSFEDVIMGILIEVLETTTGMHFELGEIV